MKKFIETLQNIWRIEDLRNRIILTLSLILIYRLGAYVVLPGVDPRGLEALQQQGQDGLIGLINMFSGGAFSNASIFALGIMPYITASIVIQLLGMAVPYFQKLQKDGESGRKKINQLTRFLTVAIVGAQAPGYVKNMINTLGKYYQNDIGQTMETVPLHADHPIFFYVLSIAILIAGTVFVMWLGERITDKGIGNGISIIIMIGIIARLPMSLVAEFGSKMSGTTGGLVMFLAEMVFLVLVILVTILLVQGTRRVPINFAKRVVGNKQYGGVRQYVPLKVNAAGVMPIIFAQAIMMLPITLIGYASNNSEGMSWFATAFSDFNGFWYNAVFFLMIVAFTYFYTAITINPKQIAEDLKKNGGFIPGIKPGKQTANFLDTILSRVTLPGSIFLAFVAIMPAFVSQAGINQQFAQFFGGTSLLILVGVVLDTLQQIESHLLMRHYDGLTKTGRIKGRSSSNIANVGGLGGGM